MKYQSFVFERYSFEPSTGEAKFYYAFDDVLHFCETYSFDFSLATYEPAALDRALQLLFFMAGVSYYKMYESDGIVVKQGEIDDALSAFLSKTYQKGLGEFYYVNQLDPNTPVAFPVTAGTLATMDAKTHEGQLIGLGGGKDSLVSVELLRGEDRVATWSLNHRSQFEPLVATTGLQHFYVARTLDPQLTTPAADARHGHIPISAVFSCVGAVVCILTGFQDAIVSNEGSANEPTLLYQDVAINHQYSKSLEYELDFQRCLQALFGESLRYYSLLRPFSELRIAELFNTLGFDTYKNVFSSCNRAYTHDQNAMFWCGECAKCAFVFLILTPFTKRAQLEQLWHGKNLLLEPSLEPVYKQLLGIEGEKPLDCVGEIQESRAAMLLAQEIYPETRIYVFDAPTDYNYRTIGTHAMNSDLFGLLTDKLNVLT